MAETLASRKESERRLPVLLKDGMNRDLLIAIFHILREINEIKECEDWIPAKEGPEQKVIFKATLQGTSYTLVCSPAKPETKAEQTTLSPREQEIVRLASRGMSNKTIAAVLEISPWTVSTYIRRIFSKLGVNSRVEMVAIATKSGLLENSNVQHVQDHPAVREFQELINQLTLSQKEA